MLLLATIRYVNENLDSKHRIRIIKHDLGGNVRKSKKIGNRFQKSTAAVHFIIKICSI